MSAPSNGTWGESTGSAPALLIHTKQVIPALRHHSFPLVPLPGVRRPPPPRHSSALAARPAYAAPLPFPTHPLRHRPDSRRTASAAATKTKNHHLVFATPEPAPTPAAASALHDELR